MGQSVIKNPKKLYSQLGGDPSLPNRVTILENNEYKVLYFQTISSATGTITKPTNSTILLDEFYSGGDAIVETLTNGQPTGQSPLTVGGIVVSVSSFDTSGNYTLSGTPSSFDVALVYLFKIKAIDYSNIVLANQLGMESTLVDQSIIDGSTNPVSGNAVYDALALKVGIAAKDISTSSVLTGTTAITLIKSVLIPANTFTNGSVCRILSRAIRSTSTGTSVNYVYVNTSNTLSGATLVGLFSSAARFYSMDRNLYIKSSTVSETLDSSTSSVTDSLTGSVSANSDLNINWTVDQYIIHAFANAAVGNSTVSSGLIVTKI